MPQVSHSALDTIQGAVRVAIKLNVDPSGRVTDTSFESEGPSKYFARMAMQAAQNWKFKPPLAGGRQVPSTWELQFEFTRDGAKVVPTQTAP
jgi:TonB family protein